MKKLIYLVMGIGLLFSSCNPMDDIHEDIDSQEAIISGETTYTLTEDDYKKELKLSFANFNSSDEAKTLIPGLLSKKYPVWGEGSLATITYDLYAPKRTQKSLIVYTVSSSDYATLGFNYGNFSKYDDMITFLNWKYPNPADRVLVSLTYKYYSGVVNTLKNGFIYVNGEWNMLQGFTKDNYAAMGESFENFTSSTVAKERIPIFLKDYYKYDGKKAGDIASIMYNIYETDVNDIDGDGSTTDKATYSYAFYCIFDGENWSEYTNIIAETLKFGHDGSTWVPDNTIKYTLTSADYALVGNGYYNNFDVRSGKAEELESVRLDKINTILLNNFPGMAEGQKFSVSYAIYNGAAGIWEMRVILSGGKYVLQ